MVTELEVSPLYSWGGGWGVGGGGGGGIQHNLNTVNSLNKGQVGPTEIVRYRELSFIQGESGVIYEVLC